MAAAVGTLPKDNSTKHQAEAFSVLPAAAAASTDPKQSEELKRQIEKLSKDYNDYMATQKSFVPPVAHVSIDETVDGIESYIEVSFKEIDYYFQPINSQHNDIIHAELEQEIVKKQFADGKVKTKKEISEQVAWLSALYLNKDKDGKPKPVNPYSGLVVTDAETEDFLGVTYFCSPGPGEAEVGILNSLKSWSHIPKDIIKEYTTASATTKKVKIYNGVGTMEVCTLLQYGSFLKSKGYKASGENLHTIVSNALTTNIGSRNAHAKAQFELYDINSNPKYGPALRYRMKKAVK